MTLRTPTVPLLTLAAWFLASCGGGGSDLAASEQPAALPCTATPQTVPWQEVTRAAPWSPRDSAIEYSFAGQLWVMGGWEDSYAINPRDIWSSADGRDWQPTALPAPWTHGDLAANTVHEGRMWILGGWANGRLPAATASNETWSAGDGLDWRSHGPAGWDPRLGAAASSFGGRLWLAGGVTAYYDGTTASLRSDLWSTTDGDSWTLVTAQAPWAPRAYHQMVAHEGRLFVLGGGNYQPSYEARNDVWSTSDGVNWRRETEAAPWHPRIWFSAVSYRGYLWVLGGWSNLPYKNWGDVWYSRDGANWAPYVSSTQWTSRHEQSVVVHADQIWVAGGFAAPLINDVWRLDLPPNWVGSCAAQARI